VDVSKDKTAMLSSSKWTELSIAYKHQADNTRALAPVIAEHCAANGVHILRHTFCSHLAMRAQAKAIQELAGHQDLSMTQRYMHLSPAALDAAIQLLEGRGNQRGTGTDVPRQQAEMFGNLQENWR
jgi:site-specific recombinase XerD